MYLSQFITIIHYPIIAWCNCMYLSQFITIIHYPIIAWCNCMYLRQFITIWDVNMTFLGHDNSSPTWRLFIVTDALCVLNQTYWNYFSWSSLSSAFGLSESSGPVVFMINGDEVVLFPRFSFCSSFIVIMETFAQYWQIFFVTPFQICLTVRRQLT